MAAGVVADPDIDEKVRRLRRDIAENEGKISQLVNKLKTHPGNELDIVGLERLRQKSRELKQALEEAQAEGAAVAAL